MARRGRAPTPRAGRGDARAAAARRLLGGRRRLLRAQCAVQLALAARVGVAAAGEVAAAAAQHLGLRRPAPAPSARAPRSPPPASRPSSFLRGCLRP